MRKVALVTSVVRMAGQGRMVDPFHLGMSVKKGCNAQGIGYMALYPKRKCFQSLKQQESIERADGGTCVTQQDGTDAGDIGCMAGCFTEAQAVVTRVGSSQLRKLARSLPVKFAGINDDASERSAVSADKFGSRMHYDVGSVFNGTDQERRSESVVHDERDLMTVGNFCHGFQIRDVRIGVAQRFNKQGFGFLADGLLKV